MADFCGQCSEELFGQIDYKPNIKDNEVEKMYLKEITILVKFVKKEEVNILIRIIKSLFLVF
jgi:hypothetical protein